MFKGSAAIFDQDRQVKCGVTVGGVIFGGGGVRSDCSPPNSSRRGCGSSRRRDITIVVLC